jgi:hypothetical protein
MDGWLKSAVYYIVARQMQTIPANNVSILTGRMQPLPPKATAFDLSRCSYLRYFESVSYSISENLGGTCK